MSFNSQFKLIFGETFQTEGFRYCSKLNVFVKMLNEDLMAFFGVKTAPAWNKGAKGFFLTAGIISTYHSSIDKKSILYAGQDLNSFLPRNEARVSFEYTEDTMEEIISATALYVKERLMPIFNRVYDLDSFIDFLKEYSINKLRACDTFEGESLVLIKTEITMMIFKRISSSIWMNYTHKLMQEMLVMAIRKKWLMMICFMVLSKVLYILGIKYILTRVYIMRRWKRLREEKVKI